MTFLFGVSNGRLCRRLPAGGGRGDAESRVRIGDLVEFDGPVRFAERILGHAFVSPEIGQSHRADLESHVDAIGIVRRNRFVLVTCKI